MNLNQQQTAYLSDTYNRMEQKFRAECHRMNGRIPYISIDGAYPTWDESMINWWTNGFWGGIMWQLYHAENSSDYMSEASCLEEHLEKAFEHFDLLDHDVGFLWLHTAVAHYRLTGDPTARQRGLRAAAVLASRYCPAGEYIRAWNRPGLSQMIIDCVMNLPLLFWAASEGAGDHYRQIAIHHLDRVLTHIIREDGSCNHIVEFDEATGEVLNIPGGQGYGENSSWSRGQSWAIYGLALAYRYTKKTSYLNAAKTVAHYFLANIALTDYVSLIDFRAPADPVYYDTTASACAACGLLEIAEWVDELERPLYEKSAWKVYEKLTHDFSDWNPDRDGILQYGSAKYHRAEDRQVPIIYGDYFLLEASLRLQNKAFLIW